MLGIGLGVMKNRSVGSSPSIDFSFVDVLPAGTVFTRASPAWAWNNSRDLIEVDSGSAVFEFIEGFGGFRREGERTNLQPHGSPQSGFWNNTRADWAEVVQERGMRVQRIWVRSDTSNNTHNIWDTFTGVVSGQVYSFSAVLKEGDNNSSGSRGWCYLRVNIGGSGKRQHFNILSGTSEVGDIGLTPSIQNLGSGWYRVGISFTTTDSVNLNPEINISSGDGNTGYTGQDSRDLLVMHSQFELGGFPSSIIATSGSIRTRVADVAVNTTLMTSIDVTEGVFLIKFSTMAGSGSLATGGIFSYEHSTTDYIRAEANFTTNNFGYSVASGNTLQFSLDTADGSLLPFTEYTAAIGYEASSFSAVFDDEAALNNAADTLPGSADTLDFGRAGTNELFGWFRNFRYYDNRLSNSIINELVL